MNVLIVKIGAIGDAVMALSMLDVLFRESSNARVTWVCGKTIEPLLQAFGKINEIIVLDDVKLLTGNSFEKATVIVTLWTRLFGRRFDLVVTAHPDSRYRWLSLPVLGKVRRVFRRDGRRTEPVPGRFHPDEYVRLVTGVDGPNALKARIPELRCALPEFLSPFFEGATQLVALAPGGAKNILRDDALRRWPIERYAAVCEMLLNSGVQVVLTGSSTDKWVCDSFKGLAVVDLIGKLSLPDLVAVYGSCDLVVTHDSGPLHLAALAGAPVLGLFGPTNPHEKLSLNGRNRMLWGGDDLPCRPCYDGKDYANCPRNLCMHDISVERVYREALQLLERGNVRKSI